MKPINSDQQYYNYCNQLEELMKTDLATQEAKNKYHELVTHIHNWDDKHREPAMLNFNTPKTAEAFPELKMMEMINTLKELKESIPHTSLQDEIAETMKNKILEVAESYPEGTEFYVKIKYGFKYELIIIPLDKPIHQNELQGGFFVCPRPTDLQRQAFNILKQLGEKRKAGLDYIEYDKTNSNPILDSL